jgi:hypothetical protein
VRGNPSRVLVEALVWGGTQITWTRAVAAVIAQGALIAYVIWAARYFGR